MARIVYTDMSGQERSVPIGPEAPVVSIGRATDCTIRSNRKSVSRRHAEFRFSNDQFEVVDLNSSNGTYLIINEERKPVLGREYLAHNDEVWCGDFILRFFEEESANAEPYNDDSTFNPTHPPQQQQPQQPFSAPSNGHFGQGSPQQQQQQQPQQNSSFDQSQAPWSAPPKQGPMFATSPPNQGFSGAPNSSFGGEQQYAEPAFQNEQGGFGSEPSWANEPPDFGEPMTSPPNPYEEGATQNQSGYEHSGFDTSTQNQQELAKFMQQQEDSERLVQERDAYAELAERQKGEIDDLQSRLSEFTRRADELQSELDEVQAEQEDSTSVVTPPAEVAKLRDDLAAALADIEGVRGQLRSAEQQMDGMRRELDEARADTRAEDLQRELERLRDENQALEREVATAREMAAAPDHEAQAEISDLRGQLEGKDRDIAALESEVDRLSAEMQAVEQNASEQTRAEAQKAREETEALRRELERHKRLVEEFEKRNRDLQADLEAVKQGGSELQSTIEEGEAKRAELEAELEALAADLENARTERDQAVADLEDVRAQGNVADLRNEIEGLKHRLKMAKERAGEGDAKLTDEIDRLNAQLAELESDNSDLRGALQAATVGGGATADDIALLHEKVEALDRIVDAIVRTNLDPLSTVDRIRLQSAIRDTDPKATLASLLDLTSSD